MKPEYLRKYGDTMAYMVSLLGQPHDHLRHAELPDHTRYVWYADEDWAEYCDEHRPPVAAYFQACPEQATVGLDAPTVGDDHRYLAIAGFCAVHKVLCQWFNGDEVTFVVIGAFAIEDEGEGDKTPPDDVEGAMENQPIDFDMLVNEATTRH
jgi:hypothetical protein